MPGITIVKPRRLVQTTKRAPGPHHSRTAHRDPAPHEILAATTTTTTRPLPRSRPVPASTLQRGARTLPSILLASAHRSRQSEQKLLPPPPLLPSSSPFPPPFPPPSHPAFSPRASFSDPSPDSFLLGSLRLPARPIPPRVRRSLVVRFPSTRFVVLRHRRPHRRRPGAQQDRFPSTGVFTLEEASPTSSSAAFRATGAGLAGSGEIHPGLDRLRLAGFEVERALSRKFKSCEKARTGNLDISVFRCV